MKELITGIVTAVASIIVFTPTILVGIIFNCIYPFYMAIKERSVLTFFIIVIRLIDGTLATIGNFLRDGFAVHYDEMGNVWGEWIEDAVTPVEETMFGEKNITISQSLGHLEHEKLPILKRGKTLSKVLNVAFREKCHAIGSWKKWLAYKKIEEQNLKCKEQ
jgi:hypothetical protein